MQFEIKSYVGVGQVSFGMSREQVRTLMQSNVRTFKKSDASEILTDAFADLGVHVFYDENDYCEAIEFGHPSEPLFMGKKLIGLPYREVKKLFEEIDDSLDEDGTGFISFNCGIGVFVPTLKESQDEPVQGVIVFRNGYYD